MYAYLYVAYIYIYIYIYIHTHTHIYTYIRTYIYIYIYISQFHLSLLGSLASLRTYRHLVAKVGTSKDGGKQWQTTPKNLPRMQCARAIPVTRLSSGSCQPGL